MVWLYRRPILDYWAEHEETLGSLVTHVLVHEIGHHFGLSDPDMEAIEAAAEESRAEGILTFRQIVQGSFGPRLRLRRRSGRRAASEVLSSCGETFSPVNL